MPTFANKKLGGSDGTYNLLMKADTTGEVKTLELEYPDIFYGLLRNNPDLLLQGMEDLDEMTLPTSEKVYMLVTPEAAWIVDSKGKVIGEEKCGFADLKYTKYNTSITEIIRKAKSLI